MKGDFTRSTFDPKKHYSRVLMQQGRVQVDADWNEQQDLTLHRIETETVDVVGVSGGPMHGAGFEITRSPVSIGSAGGPVPQPSSITARSHGELTGGRYGLIISAGRYYVDGILCENDTDVSYELQPGLPDPVAIAGDGTYLAYLDVWSRHITALEDPRIREVALNGPDTATREQTVWQVRLVKITAGTVGTVACSKVKVAVPASGLLAARANVAAPSIGPCDVAPGAAYRRLENQLYRVEVHDGGTLGAATFKWSRDNGSIVTRWESQDPNNLNNLTVGSIGRDKVLNFASGQWVELTDDTHELLGQPGTLVQLAKAEGQALTIDPATAKGPVELTEFPKNPKVRRWDMSGLLKTPNSNTVWVPLEDGVEIQFSGPSGSTFKTGDYWMIPARTATADVEWPKDPTDPMGQLPAKRLPDGIQHHLCNLALLSFNQGVWTRISDCRRIFPPVTELTSFFYVGGDGQEAMPDFTPDSSSGTPDTVGAGGAITERRANANPFTELPQPIEVGVANGKWPVEGATVRFRIVSGGGRLRLINTEVIVQTNSVGIASCEWSLGPWRPDQPTSQRANSQRVEARLLNDAGEDINVPIHFNASLSVADHVAYDPMGCGSLANQITVQDAIDRLSSLASLFEVSGNYQSGKAGEPLIDPLVVVAASKCGPVARGPGIAVAFNVISGGGSVLPFSPFMEGQFACRWTLGTQEKPQVVEAELTSTDPTLIVPPTRVRFTATIQPAVAEFHVTGLFFRPTPSGPLMPLRNDMVVPASRLLNGIQIEFDDHVDSTSFISLINFINQSILINKPVCFVTLEIPFFAQVAGASNRTLIGVQPVILDGRVGFAGFGFVAPDSTITTPTSGREISRPPTEFEDPTKLDWIPNTTPPSLTTTTTSAQLSAWIDSVLVSLKAVNKSRLLARLTLKGNYIWGERDPEHYLDGEAFGVVNNSPFNLNDIRIPSGDQKRGGDLEVWFWIMKESVAVVPRSLPFVNIAGNGFQKFTIRNVSDEAFELTGIGSTDAAVFASNVTSEKDNDDLLTKASPPLSARAEPQLGIGPAFPITIGPGQVVTVTVTLSCGSGTFGRHAGSLTINTDPSVEAGEVEFEWTCQAGGGTTAAVADSVDKKTRKKIVSRKKKPVARKKPVAEKKPLARKKRKPKQ